MSDRLVQDHAWLGIDLGTQGVRAVLVGPDGSVLGSGSAPLVHDVRSGVQHEQDPTEWWTALCTATQLALADHRGLPVGGLAVSSTSGTLVVQDRDGRARRPALMYDDARAVAEADQAQRAGQALWSRLGYRIQRSWALPKLVWLQRAGELADGATVAHQADHVTARLTGSRTASDTSHSLKSGYDLLERRWPLDVLDTLDVDPTVLPAVVMPGDLVGHVSAQAAAETGIAVGTPVRAGMTDGCAAQVAARALTPGSWSTALGTTLVIKGATHQLLHDPSGAVYSHLNPDGGWLPGGASSTGAGIIARDFAGLDLDELTAAAAAHLPTSGVTYPLPGQGERFPFVAPSARGFSTAGDQTPVLRFAGVLQGVALLERLAYDVLAGLGADTSGPVTLSGGATRNHGWNQLRADVLGRPALLPQSVEAAVGMAVLAAAPPGQLGATADTMVRIARVYEPDPARGAQFTEPYALFCTALVDRGWLDAGSLAGGS